MNEEKEKYSRARAKAWKLTVSEFRESYYVEE